MWQNGISSWDSFPNPLTSSLPHDKTLLLQFCFPDHVVWFVIGKQTHMPSQNPEHHPSLKTVSYCKGSDSRENDINHRQCTGMHLEQEHISVHTGKRGLNRNLYAIQIFVIFSITTVYFVTIKNSHCENGRILLHTLGKHHFHAVYKNSKTRITTCCWNL